MKRKKEGKENPPLQNMGTPGELVLAAAVDRRHCPVLPLLVVVSCVVALPVVVAFFPSRCR